MTSNSTLAPCLGPDEEAEIDWFVFPLSFVAGISLTLAAVSIAYPAHVAARTKVEPARSQKLLSLSANLLFTGLGVGLSTIASGYASVAVTFPATMGMNLLSNMVLQAYLGIASYTKNFVVGTLVLTAAVVTLKDLGPRDPGDISEDQIRAMLLSPLSVTFIIISLVAEVLGMCIVTRKWVTLNNSLMFAYAVMGASINVMNAAIGKLVQMNLPVFSKVVLGGVYAIQAVIGLAVQALANGTLEDPSRFIPVVSGMNLIVTMVAGLCVWGDWARIKFPAAYAMIYIIISLAIYDVSDFDLSAKESSTSSLRQSLGEEGAREVKRSTGSLEMLPGVGIELSPRSSVAPEISREM